MPTAPTHLRTADVEADPIRLNSQLGTYTNFVNLLDWSARLPAGFRSDGLPFGITFIAPAWSDLALCELGERWQRHVAWPRGATGRPLGAEPVSRRQPRERREPAPGHVRLAVVGAHLTGMPLNRELTDRHAVLVERATTSTAYRSMRLPEPSRPSPAWRARRQARRSTWSCGTCPRRPSGPSSRAFPRRSGSAPSSSPTDAR